MERCLLPMPGVSEVRAAAVSSFTLDRAHPLVRPSRGAGGTPCVGRDVELSALRKRFEDGHRLVTLVGLGGMGKSRLAREYVARYESSAAVIDLSRLETREALERALSSRARTWSFAVLDNCERIVADGDVIAAWMQSAPGLRVLVTSRVVLRLSEETIFELAPLDSEGVESSAAQLFVNRIRHRLGHWSARRDELAHVGRIVHDLDGIPLALEVAADRAAAVGLASVLPPFDRHRSLGSPACRDVPKRQRSMRQVLDASWDALDDDARTILRACSVLSHSFDVEMVFAMVGDDEPVVEVLECLRHQSWLLSDESGRLGRMRLLRIVREYLQDKVARTVKADLAHRASDYFLEQGKAKADDQVELSRFVTENWQGIAAAIEHRLSLAADSRRSAVELLLIVGDTAVGAGHAVVVQRYARTIIDEGGVDTSLVPALWLLLSNAEAQAGDIHLAATHLEEAANLVDASRDVEFSARITRARSLRLAQQGQLDEAIAEGRLSETCRAGSPDVLGLSSALLQSLEFSGALLVLEDYLRVATDPVGRARALVELAFVHLGAGDAVSCRRAGLTANAELERLGLEALQRRAQLVLALEMQMSDRLEEAEVMLRALASRNDEASSVPQYAAGYLGVLCLQTQRYQEADELLARARPFDRGHVALFSAYRCAVAAARGDVRLAKVIASHIDRNHAPPCLLPAIELQSAHIDVADARRLEVAMDFAAAARARDRAYAAVARTVPAGMDILLARRIAMHAIEEHWARRRMPKPRSVFVHERGEWFSVDAGPRVDCTRNANWRKALLALAHGRLARPARALDVSTLIGEIWNGERIRHAAGHNRLRVTIAGLRKAGLSDILVRENDGYKLSEWAFLTIG